jgi:CRP-like cAMP-binding protein
MSGRTYLNISLTRAQIADTIGLSIVHTNKTLQSLRRSNVVEWTPDRIGIHDIDAAIACAKYDLPIESPRPFI